jgi:uncharacterized protein YndB with AHSA1/START domain
MQERAKASATPADRELTITRLFAAPRALVFAAWTKDEHLAHWSGPEGFTTTEHSMDLRVGGEFRACLRSPEGTDHRLRGVYREIVPPERLVFTHAWEDAAGGTSPETIVTITFAEEAGRTRMTFHQAGFTTVGSRDGHRDGWSSSFNRLEQYLSTRAAASRQGGRR